MNSICFFSHSVQLSAWLCADLLSLSGPNSDNDRGCVLNCSLDGPTVRRGPAQNLDTSASVWARSMCLTNNIVNRPVY